MKPELLVRKYADNIIGTYLDADDVTRKAGGYWYAAEHDRLAQWAEEHRVSHVAAIGAASAISPGMPWEWATVYLSALMKNRRAKVPTYSREFVERAHRCLKGEDPLDVLSGLKVTAFYSALLNRGETFDVVIDGHAWNIARGGWSPLRGKDRDSDSRVTPARYRLAADAYRLAAKDLDVRPCAVQASTWLYWRMLIKAK